MTKTTKHFENIGEASAFLEGLEYVNDEALSWGMPYQPTEGGWAVDIEDRDGMEENDE